MCIACHNSEIFHIKITRTCAECLDILSSGNLLNRSLLERDFIDDLGYSRGTNEAGAQIGRDIAALRRCENLHFLDPSICEDGIYYIDYSRKCRS